MTEHPSPFPLDDLPGYERGLGADPQARMKRPGWDRLTPLGGELADFAKTIQRYEETRRRGVPSSVELYHQAMERCAPGNESCDKSRGGFIAVEGRKFPVMCERKSRHCWVGRIEYVNACRLFVNQLGYGGDYDAACFDHPKFIQDSDLSQRAMRYAREGELASKKSLALIGDTGPGKTFNSLAILAHAKVELGIEGKLWVAPLLLNHHAGELDDIKAAMTTRLLVLDDLGRENNTEHTQSSLLTILDRRLSSGFPTIITTNIPPDKWKERYTEKRLQDRLRGGFSFFATAETSKRGIHG